MPGAGWPTRLLREDAVSRELDFRSPRTARAKMLADLAELAEPASAARGLLCTNEAGIAGTGTGDSGGESHSGLPMIDVSAAFDEAAEDGVEPASRLSLLVLFLRPSLEGVLSMLLNEPERFSLFALLPVLSETGCTASLDRTSTPSSDR